ncbi:MAG TPA: hypothetical protein VGI99_12045 [Gemmataceae bacterium]|jgi:hypothetical protein
MPRITERTAAAFSGARIDREAGTITNVLICGTLSANGREYPAEVLRRDHGVYEGKPVNCDHSKESTVDRRFGWFSNVRPGEDGRPRGTLNALKSHPMFDRVFEAAERHPALFGFSHVAECRTSQNPATGRERIEAITNVLSIDLVADPATTAGLFESRVSPDAAAFLESITAGPRTIGIQRPAKPAKAPPRRRSESRSRPVTDRQSFLDAISE